MAAARSVADDTDAVHVRNVADANEPPPQIAISVGGRAAVVCYKLVARGIAAVDGIALLLDAVAGLNNRFAVLLNAECCILCCGKLKGLR